MKQITLSRHRVRVGGVLQPRVANRCRLENLSSRRSPGYYGGVGRYARYGHFACLLVLLAVSITPTTAGALPNGDFEDADKSWTVVGDSQAVQFTADKPAAGRICLRLEQSQSTAGWAVSAPLQDLPPGPLELALQARHISGVAELAVAFVAQTPQQPESISPLWHISLPTDNKWHRLQVGLVVPRPENSPLHLAVGLIGEPGLWQVDQMQIEQYSPPDRTAPGPSADIPAAVAPAPLPSDWEPEGDLDATRRRVGNTEELIVNVNGLGIGVSAEATVPRGVRQGLLTYVVNRGQATKQLTVSIQGPPGTFIPDYTVPIAPRGTTRFFPPVQMLRTGTGWVKITFSSGGQSAAMPIRLQCRRAYPAMGWIVRELGDILPGGIPGGLTYLPAQFYDVLLTGSSADWAAVAEMLSQLDGEVALQLPGLEQANWESLAARLRETDAQDKVALAGVYLSDSGADTSGTALVAEVQQFAERIGNVFPGASLMSPPVSLTATPAGLRPSPQLAEALAAGLAPLVDSLAVRLPPLPAGAVLAEQVDGRPRKELSEFWSDFDRHFDFAPLRAYLNETGSGRPLFLAQVGAAATGDRRLDALLNARLIIKALAQGAMGATVLAPPEEDVGEGDQASSVSPMYAAVQELTRELAGAVPLACLAGTKDFSGRQDRPVVYRVFRREDEGILFMWNNTSAPLDVAVVLHCMPLQLHVVRLSYWGDFVTRQFEGLFTFSEEAQRNHQSAVYVRLPPLQIVGLTFNLKGAHSGWLRQIAPRPPVSRRRGPSGQRPHEPRPWGLGPR